MKILRKQLYHTDYFETARERVKEVLNFDLHSDTNGTESVYYNGRTKLIEGKRDDVRLWIAMHYELITLEETIKKNNR